MLEILAAALTIFQASYVLDPEPQPDNLVYLPTREGKSFPLSERVRPQSELRYKNVVKQRYDFSCGSAALSTLLIYYLGENITELDAMRGMLRRGERQQIIERQAFSLLDMKKYVNFLGYEGAGFEAEVSDLKELDRPVIIPIKYGGFEHFVVLKNVAADRAFIADPAQSVGGNNTLTLEYFKELWEPKVLFMVYPGEKTTLNQIALSDQDLRYYSLQPGTLDKEAFRALQREELLKRTVDKAARGVGFYSNP